MQVPTPSLGKHPRRQPAVHAFPSHAGGTTVQLPPEQVDPLPPQSASEQHEAAQAQVLPCFT